MPKKRKLILIDGYAIIYRAFHAIPHLATKEGELVNAVYGFSLILLNVLKELKPTHIAVALDTPGETVRHKMYKKYKEHRIKAPDEMYEQIPRIKEVLKGFNIPIFEKRGYEADDIIGTLVGGVKKYKNLESIIVTGDLDTLQLVQSDVKVYTMKRGLTDTVIYDRKMVLERYGFPSKNLIDFKGLRGDASDNIPGVPGIGEKTATDLIVKYGTIEEIYEALGKEKVELSDRYKTLLKENKEQALLSKKLATMISNLPVKFELKNAELHDYDRTKVLKLFQELGFRSLLSKIPESKREETGVQSSLFDEKQRGIQRKHHGKYVLIDDETDLKRLVKRIKNKKLLVLDVETDELGGQVIGIAIALKAREAFYIPIGHNNPAVSYLKSVLESKTIKKIAQNIKYDYLVLKKLGIKMQGLYFDTMIAAYLLNPGRQGFNLDNLAFTELGVEMVSIEELIGKGRDQKKLNEIPLKDVVCYSCEDADITFQLYKILKPRLKTKIKKIFFSLEMPLTTILADMEEIGVRLDSLFLKKMSKEVTKKLSYLKNQIFKAAGKEFNINSTQQLREILYEKLNIDATDIRKTKTGLSTAASELEKLKGRHKIINYIFRYREMTKLKNTYLDSLPRLVKEDGRLHTSFNQTITATGRLSSSSPNLQNIPTRTDLGKKIRRAFVADPGYKIVAFDYSQIELRVVAHLSKDKRMIGAFKRDEDIHRSNAAWLFNKKIESVSQRERQEAKTANFAVLYGMGTYGLSQGMDVSREYAKEFIDNYFSKFSEVKNYLDKTKKFAKKQGYVETLFGRRRYLPEINSHVFNIQQAAERMAINMPVQGTAADILKMAMIEIDKKVNTRLLLQVHDELLFEIEKDKVEIMAKKIKNIMENIYKFSIPLKVDVSVGNSWGALKPLELS